METQISMLSIFKSDNWVFEYLRPSSRHYLIKKLHPTHTFITTFKNIADKKAPLPPTPQQDISGELSSKYNISIINYKTNKLLLCHIILNLQWNYKVKSFSKIVKLCGFYTILIKDFIRNFILKSTLLVSNTT